MPQEVRQKWSTDDDDDDVQLKGDNYQHSSPGVIQTVGLQFPKSPSQQSNIPTSRKDGGEGIEVRQIAGTKYIYLIANYGLALYKGRTRHLEWNNRIQTSSLLVCCQPYAMFFFSEVLKSEGDFIALLNTLYLLALP